MVLASGASNSAQSNGAGIIVGSFSGNPSILYTDSTTSWDFNKNIVTTGTITASGGNSTNWNSAYTTSTTAILDADFSSNGLMARSGAGTYTIVTDSSSNWNTAYGWGDHSTQGYLTASSSATLTNKGGNISQWTNDSGYISTANYVPISSPTFTGNVTVQNTSPSVILDDTDANSVYATTGSIQFFGKDSGGNSTEYARIMGQIGNNVTDGQEEGRLYFGRVTSGGSSPTNVMWLQEQDIGLNDEQTITWYNHKGTNYECVLDWATPTAANTITFPDASGTVALFDTNADLSFGDNDKAIFGTNSDLKIYSDGGGGVFETQGNVLDSFRFHNVNDGSRGCWVYFQHDTASPSSVDFVAGFVFNHKDTINNTEVPVAMWAMNNLSTTFQQSVGGTLAEFLKLDGQNDKITISKPIHGDGSNLTGIIPSQTSNSGKFLTTDGSSVSWGAVDALPSQTSNNGKYLTTDGSSASWGTISGFAPIAGPTFTDAVNINSTGYYLVQDNSESLIRSESQPIILQTFASSAWQDRLTIANNGNATFGASVDIGVNATVDGILFLGGQYPNIRMMGTANSTNQNMKIEMSNTAGDMSILSYNSAWNSGTYICKFRRGGGVTVHSGYLEVQSGIRGSGGAQDTVIDIGRAKISGTYYTNGSSYSDMAVFTHEDFLNHSSHGTCGYMLNNSGHPTIYFPTNTEFSIRSNSNYLSETEVNVSTSGMSIDMVYL